MRYKLAELRFEVIDKMMTEKNREVTESVSLIILLHQYHTDHE